MLRISDTQQVGCAAFIDHIASITGLLCWVLQAKSYGVTGVELCTGLGCRTHATLTRSTRLKADVTRCTLYTRESLQAVFGLCTELADFCGPFGFTVRAVLVESLTNRTCRACVGSLCVTGFEADRWDTGLVSTDEPCHTAFDRAITGLSLLLAGVVQAEVDVCAGKEWGTSLRCTACVGWT